MSSLVFTLEREKDLSKWGFCGSTVYAAGSLGVVIGSVFATIVRDSLTEEQLTLWGWRIPFLLGALGALPAVYLKHQDTPIVEPSSIPSSSGNKNILHDINQIESDHRNETEEEVDIYNINNNMNDISRDPLMESLGKSNRLALIAALIVPTILATSYYITFIWLVIYMDSILEPPIPHAFFINSINGIVGGILMIIAGGWFADKIGQDVKVMMVSGTLLAVTYPILIGLLGTGYEYRSIIALIIQLTMSILLAIWTGAMLPWMVMIFPPKIRLTSIGIGYNISLALWGGFSPLLATILVERVNSYAPGYIVTVTAVMSLIALYIVPSVNNGKPRNIVLHESDP